MKTREFQLDKLARAREIQDEAAALHIPVPVLSWQFEVRDKAGNLTEKGIGKSNSYTRNALNWILRTAGLCDIGIFYNVTIFGDGTATFKDSAGTITGSYGDYVRYSSNANPTVIIGTSTASESLDSYALPTGSEFTASNTSTSTSFNTTTRKAITTLSNTFYNGTGSSVDITESGVYVKQYSATYILYIRDVFDAIAVPDGSTIIWTYVTEIAYPNP